jgi:type II secretory pathway pseudopilin PulG
VAHINARREQRDLGFTLIEALASLLLVAAVAAGASQLFVIALATIRDAGEDASATFLAVQRLEQLASDIAAGSTLPGSPDNALDADVPGFSERVDAAGAPAGLGPPSSTQFVRRWRVTPIAAGSSQVWRIQVRVMAPRAVTLSVVPSGTARRAGEAVLTTVRRIP